MLESPIPAAKSLCCGEGRSSFGDRKRAYLRSALKKLQPLVPSTRFRCGEGTRYFGRAPRRRAGEVASPILACFEEGTGLKTGHYKLRAIAQKQKHAARAFPPEGGKS